MIKQHIADIINITGDDQVTIRIKENCQDFTLCLEEMLDKDGDPL